METEQGSRLLTAFLQVKRVMCRNMIRERYEEQDAYDMIENARRVVDTHAASHGLHTGLRGEVAYLCYAAKNSREVTDQVDTWGTPPITDVLGPGRNSQFSLTALRLGFYAATAYTAWQLHHMHHHLPPTSEVRTRKHPNPPPPTQSCDDIIEHYEEALQDYYVEVECQAYADHGRRCPEGNRPVSPPNGRRYLMDDFGDLPPPPPPNLSRCRAGVLVNPDMPILHRAYRLLRRLTEWVEQHGPRYNGYTENLANFVTSLRDALEAAVTAGSDRQPSFVTTMEQLVRTTGRQFTANTPFSQTVAIQLEIIAILLWATYAT